MKFRFRFASVLKQRKIERDMALSEFAKAESDVRNQVMKINGLYQEIDQARLMTSQTEEHGCLELPRLAQSEEFVKLQLIRIERERQKARELLSIMEERQDELAEKGKSLRIVEILREKDMEKFRKETQRREQIELDDLWSTRAERRKTDV